MSKFLFIMATLCTIAMNAEVNNFEAKGNLASEKPIDCIDIKSLTNKNTPADIFIGISKCLEKSNYQNASHLYLVALAYGRFDSKRVEDKTAHQAISVLRMNHLGNLTDEKTQHLQLALKNTTKNMSIICESIKQLGLPSYHPSYMIQHGMGAFLGNKSKNGLVADFNPTNAWDNVLLNYVKCPS